MEIPQSSQEPKIREHTINKLKTKSPGNDVAWRNIGM